MSIFKMGETTIKYSSHYKYLGIVFSENGSNMPAISTLANQDSKALFTLMRGASKLSFPKLTLLGYLFDALVRPVADYGNEICGHTQAEELQLIHRRFCKFCTRSTKNYNKPGMIRRNVQIIKCWLRIHTISPLVKHACSLATSSSLPWTNFVKQISDNAGFSYVWLNPANDDPQQIWMDYQTHRPVCIYKIGNLNSETTEKLRTY